MTRTGHSLTRRRALTLAAAAPVVWFGAAPRHALAQGAPLRIEITEGAAAPLALALPPFIDEGGAAEQIAPLREVVAANLSGTSLFDVLPQDAGPQIARDLDAAPDWQRWQQARAEALVTATARMEGERLQLRFRLYDIYSAKPLGDGLQFDASPSDWRRLAHKLADQVYARLTGESPYFDSRIAFVAESGPRIRRVKRIAIMDSDGANLRALTDGQTLVLTPRFAPDGRSLVFVSYASGMPRIAHLDLGDGTTRLLPGDPGTMSFAPLVSPDGRWIFYSREKGGDTDIWQMDAASGLRRPVTTGHGIDTAPSLSPDSSRMIFESDRSGTQQLYAMPLDGSAEPERISFGEGRYGTPAWSPKGDLIAFTLQQGSRYHIGVMRPDGSGERLLTDSPHDEGPTWAPNGRVVLFTRQDPGGNGLARLHSVDIGGRNMRLVELKDAASDPAWGPLRS